MPGRLGVDLVVPFPREIRLVLEPVGEVAEKSPAAGLGARSEHAALLCMKQAAAREGKHLAVLEVYSGALPDPNA